MDENEQKPESERLLPACDSSAFEKMVRALELAKARVDASGEAVALMLDAQIESEKWKVVAEEWRQKYVEETKFHNAACAALKEEKDNMEWAGGWLTKISRALGANPDAADWPENVMERVRDLIANQAPNNKLTDSRE